MSRAYRIQIRESGRQILRAQDHVSTSLQLLEILPPERTAELLADELKRRGFQRQAGKLVRATGDGLICEIDPASRAVTVRVEQKQEVMLEAERKAWSDSREGAREERDALRVEALKDMQRQADVKRAELQKKVTDQLEAHLLDLRRELDQVVNRVTAEALKEKAAHLGQIKELSEDPATGSLTIVLEV